jgi:hypothetical protein
MRPSTWNRKRLFWQVVAPIFGPILISATAVVFWASIDSTFSIKWDVILDVSPWALTFYTGTLVGATMDDFWPKVDAHRSLAWGLLGTAMAVSLYAAPIVIKRHDASFTAGTRVYGVTLMLLGISVVLCHQATKA